MSSSSRSEAVKLIRRHATVASIKRQALAAASANRTDELRRTGFNFNPVGLFARPLTRIGKPRALFVVANRDVRVMKRCRLLYRKDEEGRPPPLSRS
jgi:hypothetical protein